MLKRPIFTTLFLCFWLPSFVLADKVCMKLNTRTNKLVKRTVTTGNCARGFIEVVDTSVLVGPAGDDGVLGVWGDGSDGDITLADLADLDHSKQYQNITIAAGTTVFGASGQTIRCTGTITIAGTLTVNYGGSGGFLQLIDGSTYFPSNSAPLVGLATAAPQTGECSTGGSNADGGNGGIGFGGSISRYPTRINPADRAGGGAGAPFGPGGSSGPAIAFNCRGGIVISSTGVIDANGGDGVNGGGGAGGGIVVLASNGTITNDGTINVTGGDGGASTTSACSGGGGGGGFVHFIAPTVANNGTVNNSGGALGSTAVAVTDSPRCGGGGGGASYGSAGAAHQVTAANTCSFGNVVGSAGGVQITNPAGGSVEALLF